MKRHAAILAAILTLGLVHDGRADERQRPGHALGWPRAHATGPRAPALFRVPLRLPTIATPHGLTIQTPPRAVTTQAARRLQPLGPKQETRAATPAQAQQKDQKRAQPLLPVARLVPVTQPMQHARMSTPQLQAIGRAGRRADYELKLSHEGLIAAFDEALRRRVIDETQYRTHLPRAQVPLVHQSEAVQAFQLGVFLRVRALHQEAALARTPGNGVDALLGGLF